MKNFTTKSIILGNKDLGENGKSIYLYSEDLGKIRVIAKGSKKINSKFTGHLETLNTCITELYFGPKNIILREIKTIKNNKFLRNNYSKLETALKLAEITNKLIYENQIIKGLFPLLEETLFHLKNTNKEHLTYIAYTIKFLEKTGQLPNFKDLEGKLEKKYLKFFEYIKSNKISKIENISIEKNEDITIREILQKLFDYNHTKLMIN